MANSEAQKPDKSEKPKKSKKGTAWGKPNPDEKGPPEIDQLFRQLFGGKKNKPALNGTSKTPRGVFSKQQVWKAIVVVLVIVILLWAITGFYVVQPSQQGVLTRFGRYVKTEAPGTHWYPHWISMVHLVDVDSTHTVSVPSSMVLPTGGALDTTWTVSYQVVEPKNYLYNVAEPESTLRALSESVIYQTMLTHTETLGGLDTHALTQAVQTQIRALATQYRMGIAITKVAMTADHPPKTLAVAMKQGAQAQQQAAATLADAKAYAARVVPAAKEKAETMIQLAKMRQKEQAISAETDLIEWNALLPVYEQYPAVMRTRLYYDTMTEILKKAHVVIVPSAHLTLSWPTPMAKGSAVHDTTADQSAPAKPPTSAVLTPPEAAQSSAISGAIQKIEYARWRVAND